MTFAVPARERPKPRSAPEPCPCTVRLSVACDFAAVATSFARAPIFFSCAASSVAVRSRSATADVR